MTPADLLALAEQLEQASGPDRELDEAIADALRPPQEPVENEPPPGFGGGDFLHLGHWGPDYTSSLDCAMTLLPGGWAIDRLAMWPSGSPISCRANLLGIIEPSGFYRNREVQKVCAHGCSMPLALCAAALRARAATLGDGK